MKLLKTLILGAVALALAGSAANAATVYCRITGSTAYRSPASLAICQILAAQGSFTWAYTNTTGSGLSSNAQIWSGTLVIGGTPTPVIIKASWSGSEAGIQTVDKNGTGLAILWLHDDNITNAAGLGSPAAAGTNTGGGGTGGCQDPTTIPPPSITTVGGYTNFESVIPDACMSDTFQASSQFQGSVYPALQESVNSPVGVVPFVWVASPGAGAAGLTNMTDLLCQTQWGSIGTLPLSFYNGNPAASGTTVYATGRNPDSGTRATAFIDTGLGVGTTVHQFEPKNGSSLITGTGSTITSLPAWPRDTVNGITDTTGKSGYTSGGQLAGGVSATVGSGTFVVTYLGVPDAVTAVNAGATQLSYDGMSLPSAPSISGTGSYNAIYNGQYGFWGYEHEYYLPSINTNTQSIADQISGQEQTAAIVPLGNMQVGRTLDGGTITLGNPY